MSGNDWADDFDHPALLHPGGVDRGIIRYRAVQFAAQLAATGSAHAVIEPDDGTTYEVMAVRRFPSAAPYMIASEAPYLFASNHGPAYPWNAKPTIHPGYAIAKWVADGGTWTGVVFALFMNDVADELETLTKGTTS